MGFKLNMIKIKDKLENISCPNHNEYPKITIKEQDKITVDACCEEFIADIYDKFGKECVKQGEDAFKKMFKKFR